MSFGVLGDMFDINCDGEINALEQGLEFMFLDSINNEENNENKTEWDFWLDTKYMV